MESQEEIRSLYRKLGFSTVRRSGDDLAELFVRFLNEPRRPGSQLGQLLGHASDREPVSQRLAAEGIADVDAFFAGSSHSEDDDTLGDLLLERFLVEDMDDSERARIASRLDQSPDGRALFDRLLKQRLIFLADYPAEPFAERVAELRAAQAITPAPRRPRPSLRWVSIPVAAAAAAALLGVGIFTQARSPEPSPRVVAATNKPTKQVATPKPETAKQETPTPAAPAAQEPRQRTAERALTRERGSGARLIAYARAGSEVRPLADGDEVGADERLVAWVKTSEAGYAAVIAVEPERTRAFFAERGEAVAVPAGGPTRLGKGKPLPADDVELVLLVAAEPFSVRPILARMRRGGTPAAIFDGTVRRMRVRATTTEVAGGQ